MRKIILIIAMFFCFSLISCNKVEDEIDYNKILKDVTLQSATIEYDGNPHSIRLENLPDGYNLFVNYSNNNQIEVGTYEVIASITDNKNNVLKTLKASLTITKKPIDVSIIKLEDKTFEYDGNEHSLEAINIPEGVTVIYSNNNQKNPGKYLVEANFIDAEGNQLLYLSAHITITNKKYNLDTVKFEDKTFDYDGKEHSIYGENIPSELTVTYENNGKTLPGNYTVVMKIKDTFGELLTKEATLIINKKIYDLSKVEFNDATFYFDSIAHSIYATNIPSELKVEYLENGKIEIGEYTVTLTIKDFDDSILLSKTATLNIIEKEDTYDFSNVLFEDAEVSYDGAIHSIEVTNIPAGLTVTYSNNNQAEGGNYEVHAYFKDSNGIIVKEMIANLIIIKNSQEGNYYFPGKFVS